MMLATMNLYLTLLWGLSALFSVGTMSASIPQTSSTNSTAGPRETTAQLNISHVLYNESQTQTATQAPMLQPVATAASHTMESREANLSSAGYGSSVNTTASSWRPVFASAAKAAPSHHTPTSDTAETEATTSTRMTTPAATTLMESISSAASLATAAVSTPESMSSTEPGVTQFSSTHSSDNLTHTPTSTQSFVSPSAYTESTNTTNHAFEAASASDPTTWPVTKPELATTRAELPQPVSDAQTPTSPSKPPNTRESSPSSESPTTSDSNTASTSSVGIFIRPVPKQLPVLTTKPAATTTAAREASQSPPTVVQSCSSRGLVTQCLIIIASLAALATIFMVSTIVLCAKVSARKNMVKKPKEETEMMCISALLPERNYTYTRRHNPVSNGVLVLPMGGDSDEDLGDNLTLSSFLPENERTV